MTLIVRAFGVLADAGLSTVGAGVGARPRLAPRRRLGSLGPRLGTVARPEDRGGGASFDRLETIHARKTGALFVAAAEFGAVLGGARPKELAAVRSYAKNVGLAFQIVDDLLERQDPARTGKDAPAGPAPTFARHVGEEGAQAARAGADAARRRGARAFRARAGSPGLRLAPRDRTL